LASTSGPENSMSPRQQGARRKLKDSCNSLSQQPPYGHEMQIQTFC